MVFLLDILSFLITFKNTLANSFTITVDDPRENLEEEEIIAAMNLIKDKNIFQPKGYDIAACISAIVVDSKATEYDLEV